MSNTAEDIAEIEVAQVDGTHADCSTDRTVQERPPTIWSRLRKATREPVAEFFGVFTLIVFGDGVVAQVVLSKGQKGDYQSINWGYGKVFCQY